MPLQEVARKAGRPARLVSKQLLEAFGQLQCGLRLEYYTLAELLDILQQQCGRLGGITTLELANILDEEHALLTFSGWLHQGRQQQLQEVIGAIPAAFPHLLSLDLCDESCLMGCNDAAMALLAPLGSCLTALKLRTARRAPAVPPPALPHFTRLHRLTIHMIGGMRTEQVGRWLEALASMPALLELHLDSAAQPLSAALWLQGLPQSTPQLTCLALGVVADLDTTVVSLLQRGLTGLKSLSLSLADDNDEDLPVLGAVLAALAGRKGLTSLSLECTLGELELPQPLPASLQLADWTLDLGEHLGQQTVEWLLEALPCQTALTSLTLRLPCADVGAPEVLHSSLLAMPPTLVRLCLGCEYDGFDAASVMESISGQRGLTELSLQCTDMREWAGGAAAKLAAMTQLRALQLVGCRIPDSFMPVLGCLTQLRHLQLDDDAHEVDGLLTDASLPCLHPLQQLTRLQFCSLSITGPGLAAVQRLGALQELQVMLRASALQQMDTWLLPLPSTLSKLRVSCRPSFAAVHPAKSEALLDAAKLQGCTVIVAPSWGADKVYVPW
jgi:hypothetical protein